jgi:putative transposase
MNITRGYKTEIRPNEKQMALLYQFAGTARFAYNYGLARKKEVYAQTGKGISSTHLKRLGRAQRHLSRCKIGSRNRGKAKARVARLHARIAHIRADTLHKATSSLVHAPLSPEQRSQRKKHLTACLPETKTKPEQKKVKKQVKARLHQTTEHNAAKRPQVICLEDLGIEGMKQNRKLARAIGDVGMGELVRQMKYKSLWNGEHLVFADRFFPSTKQCHGCGWKWKEMTLSDRVFVCQNPLCPLFLVKQDRDGNASQNLENEARNELAASTGSYSGRKMPVDGRSATWGGISPGNSTR